MAHAKIQRPEVTDVHALKAHDALPAVELLVGHDPGGTRVEAGPALHAVALDELQLHQGNPAEQAVEGAQGAEHPAEKPADENGGGEDLREHGSSCGDARFDPAFLDKKFLLKKSGSKVTQHNIKIVHCQCENRYSRGIIQIRLHIFLFYFLTYYQIPTLQRFDNHLCDTKEDNIQKNKFQHTVHDISSNN